MTSPPTSAATGGSFSAHKTQVGTVSLAAGTGTCALDTLHVTATALNPAS